MKIKLTNVFYPHHCVADGRPQHELDEVQPDLAHAGVDLTSEQSHILDV